MSGWTTMMRSVRWRYALLLALSVVGLGACGGQRLDVNEPRASFTVSIPTQTFPSTQTLSEHIALVLAIRNQSNKTMPDVAVTLCNVTCMPAPGESYQQLAKAGEGVYAQPFAAPPPTPGPGSLAPSNQNATYQVWIVDKPPGPCTGRQGYSCAGGSFGGEVTYDANTWQAGPLKPGATAQFVWHVTAVKPGHWHLGWAVSAGLSGKSKAVLPDGSIPHGSFPVTISATPGQSYVDNNGQIVSSPNGR